MSSCVLPKGVPQGQTESGGIVLAAICWATSAQRRCHPEEALYLPTSSHLLIVNKLLSLSLSLSLSSMCGVREGERAGRREGERDSWSHIAPEWLEQVHESII